ncbi:hypothetical protein [Paraburkholderia susongensis]|uniref:Uncharacterized protein n=1 Tax=Paraburkholderia susongensis TaxID=1515439 RepID=A0A1X7L7A7_9BURK|nr:hypothetical protein [Paraburkholderia susongensis]SMG49758.1 hypothetical protein SAMN06265784_105174 [Paraburkholderia susongensis]
MACGGSAFLALWNDVDAEFDAEYNRWHTVEHVPERVGIAGFIAGRRYVSAAPAQARYFTLYALEDAGVFESAAYRDVIDRPTPWSASMRPLLQNVVRAPCDIVASRGGESGNGIACVRITSSRTVPHDCEALLDACLALPGVTAAHLGVTRSSVPGAFEKWSRDDNPTHVMLIDGVSEESLRACFDALDRLVSAHFDPACAALIDAYHLAFEIRHAQVDASLLRVAPASARSR